jgi:hypothetical protein
MFDSIVIADKPDITEKLHGESSTMNRLSSSMTGRYGGRSGDPVRIISSGFSFTSVGATNL